MIDAHLHFWDENSLKRSPRGIIKPGKNFQPSDFENILNKFKIDGAIAIQTEQSEDDTDYLLSLADQHSFIKGVIGWTDLRSVDLQHRLQYYSKFKKLKGFRLSIYDEDFILDDALITGVKQLASFGFTLDLVVNHNQLEQLLAFVYQAQEATIIVNHIAKPSVISREKTHWELNMAALSTFKNVYCKLTGLVSLAEHDWSNEIFFPYLDELMETFGSHRLIYGSDWPFVLSAATYQQQLEIIKTYLSNLPDRDFQNIFKTSAVKAYSL